jgi:hypothetical protein
MRTRQEIFDIAWTGLKSQGFNQALMAGDPQKVCAYRGAGGSKCAIGWCIPDDYDGHIPECTGVAHPCIKGPAGIDDEDLAFAGQLQSCHDTGETPSEMEASLRAFAREHDLTIPGERP